MVCWCHFFREVIPRLQAGDRKSSATKWTVESPLPGDWKQQNAAIGDWVRSATCDRAEALQRKSVDDFVCQEWDLSSLRDVQTMEAGQRVGDVVGLPQMIGQLRSRVQHWLESSDQVDWKASQETIAIDQTSKPKADHQCLEHVGRHWVMDRAQLAEDGKTPQNRSLYVGPHHQLGIYRERQKSNPRKNLISLEL